MTYDHCFPWQYFLSTIHYLLYSLLVIAEVEIKENFFEKCRHQIFVNLKRIFMLLYYRILMGNVIISLICHLIRGIEPNAYYTHWQQKTNTNIQKSNKAREKMSKMNLMSRLYKISFLSYLGYSRINHDQNNITICTHFDHTLDIIIINNSKAMDLFWNGRWNRWNENEEKQYESLSNASKTNSYEMFLESMDFMKAMIVIIDQYEIKKELRYGHGWTFWYFNQKNLNWNS